MSDIWNIFFYLPNTNSLIQPPTLNSIYLFHRSVVYVSVFVSEKFFHFIYCQSWTRFLSSLSSCGGDESWIYLKYLAEFSTIVKTFFYWFKSQKFQMVQDIFKAMIICWILCLMSWNVTIQSQGNNPRNGC